MRFLFYGEGKSLQRNLTKMPFGSQAALALLGEAVLQATGAHLEAVCGSLAEPVVCRQVIVGKSIPKFIVAAQKEHGVGLSLAIGVRAALKAPLNAIIPNVYVARGLRYFLMVIVIGVLWPMTFKHFKKLK